MFRDFFFILTLNDISYILGDILQRRQTVFPLALLRRRRIRVKSFHVNIVLYIVIYVHCKIMIVNLISVFNSVYTKINYHCEGLLQKNVFITRKDDGFRFVYGTNNFSYIGSQLLNSWV